MQGVWECLPHNSITFNENDNSTAVCQPGGCIQVSYGRALHRYISHGKDPLGLGRWCWTRYRGRMDVTIRVITAYRPCVQHQGGESTVISQHQRYLHSINDNRNPRQAMTEDLCAAIQQYRESGNQIALMIDMNADVTSTEIKSTFQLVGLQESITSKYIQSNKCPTYQQGTAPIDDIFLSPTLQLTSGGYFPFGAFPSDHWFIWAKLEFSTCFGYQMSPLCSIEARRLKTEDPKCVKKYLEDYKEYIQEHGLHLAAYELQEELLQHPVTSRTIQQYNLLQEKRKKKITH